MDGFTIFLEYAHLLAPALRLVNRFGQLSGLHAHPTKSKLVLLNTAIRRQQHEGISVFQLGETTRYLGYKVGTVALSNRSLALQLQKLRRRFITAAKAATSVQNRALILNAIILHAIMFTATVYNVVN